MTARAPAAVGDGVREIETPSLVVDLDAFERNLDLMANAVRGAGVALRPHAIAHRCPAIAKAQVARGAVGICCASIDDAEVFVAEGIKNLLLTAGITALAGFDRAAALARRASIRLVVDDQRGIECASAAAMRAGVTLGVLVAIDVSAHAGSNAGSAGAVVGPRFTAVQLAATVAAVPGLRFLGLYAFAGFAQRLRHPAARRAAIVAATANARATRDALRAAGIACDCVTGGGTGTWQLERDSGVYTEIQPGSYVFMDGDYQRNALAADEHAFEQSLYVLATVTSTLGTHRATIDAGSMALAVDAGMPQVYATRGVDYAAASRAHGVLRLANNATTLAVDKRVWLVPERNNATLDLHNWLVGVRGDVVQSVWPLAVPSIER